MLITRNEEGNLGACLASLSGVADEIVILDSESTDRTVAVAEAAGARVVRHRFDGFGAAKQRALELATGTWVLSVDADERVTPALADEIHRTLATEPPVSGYLVRRDVFFLGKRLRFGGMGNDWVLRLFRRAGARFSLSPVHEHVEIPGRPARLDATLEHHAYRTLAEHVEKMNRYTDIQAQMKSGNGVRYRNWMWVRLPWEVFARCVLRLGILDGTAGVIFATMSAYSAWLKYAKTWRPAA
ncbi:MAG TPA: glycosyltransferase family 2 protein [Gemmatimonadales bacterium]|nr:glycosyltransferase family 2 protein [Gemmatimonadales bacterium]